ncbi:MAG TPA: signal peptide peptidase SppA [Candidatus Tectomicrobia bacterium]
MMLPTKTPLYLAFLVAIALVCVSQAAVLAKEATVVQLRLHGTYEDTLPPENPFGSRLLHFKGLLDLIREAAADQNVVALSLKSESPNLGLAKVRELVQALQEFKAAGKRIYAFVEHAHLVDLLLLSVADRIAMPDAASVLLSGVSAETLYVKDFLDKLGIKMLVTHIGNYKAAFENFARSDMSPEFREMLDYLVESAYQAIQEIIAAGRGIPRARVAEAIDRAFLSAADLKALGLIDTIVPRDLFWASVQADLGVDTLKFVTHYGHKAFNVDVQNPFAFIKLLMDIFTPPKKQVTSTPKIALVYAHGIIRSGKSQLSPLGKGGLLGSETLVEALKTATDDASVQAIVLRIDSPGGSGVASDAIWRAVAQASARKPVVASMADVAASGGYYIAAGANRILAEPETLTGSIGVVAATMNVKGALDRLGIKVERVTRGRHALSLSPLTDPEQMATAPLRQLLEDFYWQFVDKVAQGRRKTRADIHAVAQGRVWTGRDAVAKGLVDELGGLQRALEVARQLAHIGPEETLEILELPPAPKVFEAFAEAFGATRTIGLALPALDLSIATPELQEMRLQTVHFLAAVQERLVAIMPVTVRLQ